MIHKEHDNKNISFNTFSAFSEKTPICEDCSSLVCRTIYLKDGQTKGYCLQTHKCMNGGDHCQVLPEPLQLQLF